MNNLWYNKCFFSLELFNALGSADLNKDISLNNDKSLDKDSTSIYLVMFRCLNKDSNILVYNYISYPDAFSDILLAYLIIKSNFKNSLTFKEWGTFLPL